MRKLRLFAIIATIILAGCSTVQDKAGKKAETYAPIEASLTHINQKVGSYFLVNGIPDGFNSAQYEEAVKAVCYSSPACRDQAQTIFDTFGLDVRKIDDIFSVMLCDKEMKWKIMEDFSCNPMKVEVQSWRI